jgi:hypothetical protein
MNNIKKTIVKIYGIVFLGKYKTYLKNKYKTAVKTKETKKSLNIILVNEFKFNLHSSF